MSDLISRQAAIEAVEFGITYAKAFNVNTGESKELFKEGNDALKKAAERLKDLPSVQDWIPVTERLPEPGSWAIWCSIKGIIQVARWKEDAIDHFFPDQGFFNLEDAVAWMELPEPYREDDHDAEE